MQDNGWYGRLVDGRRAQDCRRAWAESSGAKPVLENKRA